MKLAKVLVIEEPQEDPTVLTVDGSADLVVTTSRYPLTRYCPPEELKEIVPDHYARLADRFPVGSPPWNELMRMQHDLYVAQHPEHPEHADEEEEYDHSRAKEDFRNGLS